MKDGVILCNEVNEDADQINEDESVSIWSKCEK